MRTYRIIIKVILLIVSFVLILPFLCILYIEKISRTNHLFIFIGSIFSLLPGILGVYIRRAFYATIMRQPMKDVHIDFGTQLFSKLCSIENNVYIGAYCLIDRVTIKKGVMIASRVTISSKKFSEKEKNDIYSKNKKKEPLIDIGENTWIGEGAVIQSDIGKNCIVGSGSVIDQKVNNNTIVHGNPGKVRRVNA